MRRQEAYIVFATILLTSVKPGAEAVDFQAEVDMGDSNNEFMQMVFEQIEMLGSRKKNDSQELSQDHVELASALLQVAPVITIKGQIKDPARRLTITFTVHASQDSNHLSHHPHQQQQHTSLGGRAAQSRTADEEEDDDDDHMDEYELRGRRRGRGGVLSPLVSLVEPYVLGLAELLLNGILSAVITNFLEAATLSGDVRLV